MAENGATAALTIRSHRGPYSVEFSAEPFPGVAALAAPNRHFIVDERVADLYTSQLQPALAAASVLRIAANEQSKSLDRFTVYVEHLIARGVRRDHRLVAIGGGVLQDITAFIASTLLRGIDWEFYPTTLLAQADSCIGSKSSINVGSAKNMLGTFWPPRNIRISTAVLDTLDDTEIRSGLGEMLKVHAIAGPREFDAFAADYTRVRSDKSEMARYIRRSLVIKQALIEADEFDTGIRNIMNYGHSFGHAIETATDFAVPHGIAVNIGMDLANHVALRLGRLGNADFGRMHGVLRANAGGFAATPVPLEAFFQALSKDKKNIADRLTLILPDREARVEKVSVANDPAFRSACAEYFESIACK